MLQVDRASFEHLDDIIRLYRVLFAEMAALQPDYYQPVDEQNRAFLQEIIAGERSDILIALVDGQLTGLALVKEMRTLPYASLRPHRYAFLMDLVVDPARRDGGLGTALLQAAEQWANARQLDYLELCVLPENRRAIALYDRRGYQTVTLTMRCPLG